VKMKGTCFEAVKRKFVSNEMQNLLILPVEKVLYKSRPFIQCAAPNRKKTCLVDDEDLGRNPLKSKLEPVLFTTNNTLIDYRDRMSHYYTSNHQSSTRAVLNLRKLTAIHVRKRSLSHYTLFEVREGTPNPDFQ